MCWHIFQKNLCFPTNISLLLSHLMTWANINGNTWLLLINRFHHPWPTNSTELVEPNIKKCISWALFIIMYRPTGRTCFFMKSDHCAKSFYDSSPKTVVGHGLFSATFYFYFYILLPRLGAEFRIHETDFPVISLLFLSLWWLHQHHPKSNYYYYFRKETTSW